MKSLRVVLALLALILAASDVRAQIAGGLQGRVVDVTGAVIPNARIVLVETTTNVRQETVSSNSGDYLFSNLKPGVYRLEVSARGFQRLDRTGLTATVGQTTHADLALSPGAEMQTVNVNADAPLLQAAESDIETHIPGTTVVAMPLNTRNFINLAQLAPGVSLPPGTLLPRINGGRPRTNEYLYDGISALQPEPGQVAFFPILDDIQEFTVEADNVPAEFGRFNGGVVNVATRSGSNNFHGSLFEFFRNEDLNARNYFSTTGAKPEYRRNLYGATLGGPVIKDHLFFFGDYQGIKQLIGKTVISTIPTAAERIGIFTGVSHIFDPDQPTRPEFANDVISEPFDPAAVALLARLPPAIPGLVANNYKRTANDADHQNQFDFRVDGAFRTRDRAFARYSYFSEVEQPITFLPDGSGPAVTGVLGSGSVAGLSHVLGQQAVFDETHTFTSRLLNDMHLGYTRRSNDIAGPTLPTTASAALNIPGIPTNAAFNNALPLFTFSSIFQQLGPAASTFSQYQTGVWQLEDTMVYTRGRNAFKFGGDIRWYQLNAVSPPNPTGSFAFTTTGTNQLGGGGTTGNPFASFLLGQVDTFAIDLQRSTIRPRDHIQEYFAQDDWHVADNLTLNLGVRYTLHSPSTEKNNQGAVFNLTTQQLDYVGINGNPKSARELHWDNFAPRVGFSLLLTPKTVVRSGFGIVFIDQSGITTPFTVPQFPFLQTVQQKTPDSVNAAFVLSNGPTVKPIPLTPDAGLGQSVYTVNRKAGSGYSEQWNLAVQRAVTRNLSVDLAYVGSHIVHVGIQDSNLNQITAAQLAMHPTAAVAAAEKPYPKFQNVSIYRNNSGTTNYNAFEAKVEQRMSQGLYVLFAYTHSKLIDDASSVFSSTVLSSPNSSSLVGADVYRPYLERDSSTGDMPNVTTASVIYELPAGHGHRFASTGVANALLGGWSANVITVLQSGMPVTVTQATNNNSSFGFVTQRPTLIGDPKLAPDLRTPAKFFNTGAFQQSLTYVIGNASRNPVRGPAYRDLDASLVKKTTLPGQVQAELRLEMFDVTNTPAFAQPNGVVGNAAFGSITSTTTDPRVVQFALRLSR